MEDWNKERARVQKRTLAVVIISQILGGAGLAAGISVGALLAQDMLGSDALSGLPTGLFTLGSALAAYLVGRSTQRFGRRMGLAYGFIAGGLGAFAVVPAAVLGSMPLLFVALFVYGSGTATNLQARYAGADLAPASRRGFGASMAMVATTVGAVAGPNLIQPLGKFATSIGVPALAGPFQLAGVSYIAAGLFLFVFLRPDPFLLARRLMEAEGSADDGTPQADSTTSEASSGAPQKTAPQAAAPQTATQNAATQKAAPQAAAPRTAPKPTHQPAPKVGTGAFVGAAVMVVTQIVMVAVMTMTPIHMRAHHHDMGAVGLVNGLHIGAMWLPSLVTGALVDKFGRTPMVVAAGGTLLAAGLVAAFAPVTRCCSW